MTWLAVTAAAIFCWRLVVEYVCVCVCAESARIRHRHRRRRWTAYATFRIASRFLDQPTHKCHATTNIVFAFNFGVAENRRYTATFILPSASMCVRAAVCEEGRVFFLLHCGILVPIQLWWMRCDGMFLLCYECQFVKRDILVEFPPFAFRIPFSWKVLLKRTDQFGARARRIQYI